MIHRRLRQPATSSLKKKFSFETETYIHLFLLCSVPFSFFYIECNLLQLLVLVNGVILMRIHSKNTLIDLFADLIVSLHLMCLPIEESTVGNRSAGLLIHDAFVRDHITEQDYLVVSMGGNDVALRPTAGTIVSMLALTSSPEWLIKTNWVRGVDTHSTHILPL